MLIKLYFLHYIFVLVLTLYQLENSFIKSLIAKGLQVLLNTEADRTFLHSQNQCLCFKKRLIHRLGKSYSNIKSMCDYDGTCLSKEGR